MAGDWIKMRSDLFTHPKVVRISSALKADTLRTVGGLMSVWCLFDAHSVDGKLEGYTTRTLDDHLRWPGFSVQMEIVKWLEVSECYLGLPEFATHNGESAKRRAQDADRKRADRKASASEADKTRTRGEKRREELIPVPNGTAERVISMFHSCLPELPAARLLPAKRKAAIHTFYHWVMQSTRSDGVRRAETDEQALVWINEYFLRARDNDFLMGRGTKSAEHKNWECDIDFLISEKGKKQVIEKTKDAS